MTMKMTKVAQNKLLILGAKDAKAGTSAATCLRERRVCECATSWFVSLLRRHGYRRAILQSDGESSIVVSQDCDFVGSPFFVEMVLRESPVGEHATNGVAESCHV